VVAYVGSDDHQEVRLTDGVRDLHTARLRVAPGLQETCSRWTTAASGLPARAFLQQEGMGPDSFPEAELRPAPCAPSRGRVLSRTLQRRLRDLYHDLFVYDIWNVGETAGPLRDLTNLQHLSEVHWLPPRPPLRYLADPFPLPDGTLLAEEYGYGRRSRGRIVMVDAEGVAPAIDEAYHLSYPCVVRDQGELFCIPEGADAGTCRLYAREGIRWVPDAVLLEGEAILDPTVFLHEGRWWLLASDPGDGGFARLSAYHAPALRGPWSPHRLNPLKRDVRGGRPAGPPFHIDGVLHRPGQDCSRTYGGALVLFRIDELTPERFSETPVLHLAPDPEGPYPHGLHHLVVTEDRVLLDGKRTHHDPLFWLRRLLRDS
jgi:hypothetical protein